MEPKSFRDLHGTIQSEETLKYLYLTFLPNPRSAAWFTGISWWLYIVHALDMSTCTHAIFLAQGISRLFIASG